MITRTKRSLIVDAHHAAGYAHVNAVQCSRLAPARLAVLAGAVQLFGRTRCALAMCAGPDQPEASHSCCPADTTHSTATTVPPSAAPIALQHACNSNQRVPHETSPNPTLSQGGCWSASARAVASHTHSVANQKKSIKQPGPAQTVQRGVDASVRQLVVSMVVSVMHFDTCSTTI